MAGLPVPQTLITSERRSEKRRPSITSRKTQRERERERERERWAHSMSFRSLVFRSLREREREREREKFVFSNHASWAHSMSFRSLSPNREFDAHLKSRLGHKCPIGSCLQVCR